MLELIKIKKDYKLKDQEPVHALKGISLNFRSHEFVAILGPSGCGKTTLLNITGGLDHYDEGDLVIKGRSTKNFSESDWDTYRNHSIGFVFQSYNLIPHQTIIKNVELALTISGIGKEERTRRAKEALDLVGLKGLYKKKPNQLSGGQMQRVSIARALVNNPEIVLADEPTGALDSETSVQVMDIMKDIAKNHLVIMVTHNPELAEKYATRIVKMKDGEILDDSDPYDGKDEVFDEPKQEVIEVNKGKKKHSSMGFFTAFGLSLSNLRSKLKRTILVAIAGSIGIIGVSTVLAVSKGVNNFIENMQDDMLSAYPIQIAEESVDLNSLVTGLTTQDKKDLAKFDLKTQAGMDSMISYLLTKYTDLTNVKTNNITETLVKYIEQMPQNYYSAITYNYGIDPTNNIFTDFTAVKGESAEQISINGLTQRYIKTLMTVEGFSDYAQFVDLFAGFMKELPDEKDYIMSQYDLIAGSKYATEDNEMMLVVDSNQTLTDLIYAQMGYYPQDEFLKIAKKAIKTNDAQKDYNSGKITKEEYEKRVKEIAEKYQYDTAFDFTDILNHEYSYYPHDLIYKEDPPFVSHKEISGSLTGKFQLAMMGIDYTVILGGLSYVPSDDMLRATLIVLDNNDNLKLVMNQALFFYRDKDYKVTDEGKSVLDGKWKFSYQGMNFNLEIVTDKHPVDDPTRERTVRYDNVTGTLQTNAMGPMLTINFTDGTISETTPETPDFYCEAYSKNNTLIQGKTEQELIDLGARVGDRKVKVVGILKPKADTKFGTLQRGVYYSHAMAEKYLSDASTSDILTAYKDHITNKRFKNVGLTVGTLFNAYTHFVYDDYTGDPGEEVDPEWEPSESEGFASALNGGLQNALSDLFLSFMGGSDNLDTEKQHIRAVGGLKILEIPDEDDPLNKDKYTYDTEKLPQSISIYPKDFNTKDSVTNYLDDWNRDKTLIIDDVPVPKSEREDITYTDTIGMIITVISTLVTAISIALVAFTSLSLVVSCFMIAVITYISVMERVKEIGVIRSLGGRKKDVSRLFIAENLITGFASGALGIIVTYILQLIINAIVSPFGVSNIAALPFLWALIMVALSIFLSVISGLIPSFSASKQDPVVALRTE